MRSLLVALVLCAGCHKGDPDPGPPCDKIVDHLLEVTKQALPGHENMGALGDKKTMIGQCEARKMSKDTRTCLMAATTLDGLGACYKNGPKPAGSDRGTAPP
jgi:hypothetical protein